MLVKQNKNRYHLKAIYYLTVLLLCCASYWANAQNLQICPGETITLEGWSKTIECCHIPGIPDIPVTCTEFLQPGGTWTDNEGNIICENCVDIIVSPTENTTYFHNTPGHECPPPKPGIGGGGSVGGPPPTYEAGPTIQVEVVVERCNYFAQDGDTVCAGDTIILPGGCYNDVPIPCPDGYVFSDIYNGRIADIGNNVLIETINETFCRRKKLSMRETTVFNINYYDECTHELSSTSTLTVFVENCDNQTDCPDPGICNTDCSNGFIQTWDEETCSCIYSQELNGCTDPKAINYDPNATCNTGCRYRSVYDGDTVCAGDIVSLPGGCNNDVPCSGGAFGPDGAGSGGITSTGNNVFIDSFFDGFCYQTQLRMQETTIFTRDFYNQCTGQLTSTETLTIFVQTCTNPIDDLFTTFSWLNSIINSTNCQSGDKVELYTTGRFEYLIVEANNVRTMYNAEGTRYCGDRENFSCAEVYNLGSPIEVWNCDDNPPQTDLYLAPGIYDVTGCPGDQFEFLAAAPVGPDGSILCNLGFNGVGIDPITNLPAAENINFNIENCTMSFTFNGEGTIFYTGAISTATPATANWNFNLIYEENCRPQPPVTDKIFVDHPWLTSIINPKDCQNADKVELYQSGIFQYLLVTTGDQRTMYNDEGTRYCGDRENFSCVEVYGLEGPIDTWLCGSTEPVEPDPSSPIFDDYTWLSDYVNPSNCQTNQSVEVYNQVGYSFLIVEDAGTRTMYYQDGTYYCKDRPNFSCAEVYGLGSPDDVWNCGDTVEPPACEYDNPLTDLVWLSDFISGDPPLPQIISTHNYNGETVFVRGYGVYNCQGELICNFRNIDECPDFSFTDTFIENIYDNTCSLTDPLQLDWIEEIITRTPTDECDTHSIEMFEYAGSNYFILNWGDDCTLATPGGGSNIINCRGDVYCTTIANVTCEEAISIAWQNRVEIWRYEQSTRIDHPIFEDYSWLSSVINSTNCEEYISIKEYNLGSFAYVFVETLNGGVLYFEDGTRYCTSSNSRDCEMLYNLTNPTNTYNCDGSTTAAYDYVYTICPGESVELTAELVEVYVDCICPPCPDIGPGPQPQAWWSSSLSDIDGPNKLIVTVNPTETTEYTASTATVRNGITGCGYPFEHGLPVADNETTFLVIVDETCGGGLKTVIDNQERLRASPINIYPNPTSNIVNVDLPIIKKAQNTQSSLTLKSTNGQILHYLQLQPTAENKQQIDLGDYATGIYLLEYFNGETTTVEKIIKE